MPPPGPPPSRPGPARLAGLSVCHSWASHALRLVFRVLMWLALQTTVGRTRRCRHDLTVPGARRARGDRPERLNAGPSGPERVLTSLRLSSTGPRAPGRSGHMSHLHAPTAASGTQSALDNTASEESTSCPRRDLTGSLAPCPHRRIRNRVPSVCLSGGPKRRRPGPVGRFQQPAGSSTGQAQWVQTLQRLRSSRPQPPEHEAPWHALAARAPVRCVPARREGWGRVLAGGHFRLYPLGQCSHSHI